ncbi:hypothetical protein CLHOM_06520 [Clostridium homopropionicum DSM 5847]|uniref:RNA-binding protein KhpB N-terminal domain-containing protein n=1 Tax=Clostridium homopropionicum DSM 5847 TaxID=1121318 RepID=A0A0L6ZDK7_9CLOT|nr:hypothetical protein CLHOM_06520 [Clostridium homopropionicum DSM 5847]SFF98152.1 hypothetical protein SAMN04488501_10468 [Clostridium homopropionicum]
MSIKVFTSKTLDECIELASTELMIPKDQLVYTIIEEKKGIFIRKTSISVEISEIEKENINGSIKVENSKIIVTNPEAGGKSAAIIPSKGISIFIDGEEIVRRTEIFEDSEIQVVFEESTAERRMDISISPDQMEAYVSINYIPQNIYSLDDVKENREIELKLSLIEQKYPTPYTINEIYDALSENGIVFGLIKENIEQIPTLKEVNNLLIAKGKEVIDGIDDKINIKFEIDSRNKKLIENVDGRIDYKSIGRIESVEPGFVLATREEGQDGQDGVDVKGNKKKHKMAKKHQMKAGDGCVLKDENIVVASIKGKPSFKGNIFYVYDVHVIENDVDIKTGNIDFIGDVIVHGNVKEGMELKVGHDLIINKNVESAKINSVGDIEIIGNVINSNINAGGDDVLKINKIHDLEILNSQLTTLIDTVKHIKEFNLLGKGIHDGEIVKVLIENKFKQIAVIGENFIKSSSHSNNKWEQELCIYIIRKLVGFAPLNIKNVSELESIIETAGNLKQYLSGALAMPAEIKLSYCQDSTIKCSGSIFITGKGEYISSITSNENVIFENPGSLARGGVIKAKNEIKCKKVGSEGRVSTKLIVEAGGHIWADVAYQNTCFMIGGREYILETDSKDIHAYLNNEGELVVDKFVL